MKTSILYFIVVINIDHFIGICFQFDIKATIKKKATINVL